MLTLCDVGIIDMLPDEVLLTVFDFCVPDELLKSKQEIEEWQTLVHVCQRWRSLVFGSPRRLNLRLVFRPTTPAKETLDVWPPLRLHIHCSDFHTTETVDNIIAVLERSDRVCYIAISLPSLEKVSTAMQKSFPELTGLLLSSRDEMAPVVPDSFLGGSAPRLEFLLLHRISFPGLPKLLLSTTHLDYLYLDDIPHSGYISPDAMATALSTLINLRRLALEFQSPRSHPDLASRRPPPPTRLVLPSLTYFQFKGVTDYFDDLVTRIDTPLLGMLQIVFFNQIIFDTPQFIQFISRTPKLKVLEQAHIIFETRAAGIRLISTSGQPEFCVKIPCEKLDWQVSSLEQVCSSCLPPLSMLEDLYIYQNTIPQIATTDSLVSAEHDIGNTLDNIENTLWLELLHPFTAVKNFYLSKQFAPHIMLALQELDGGGTTEVLPTLQNIFLEDFQQSGPVHEAVGQFVAMRQVTSHDIAVSRWDNLSQDKLRLDTSYM